MVDKCEAEATQFNLKSHKFKGFSITFEGSRKKIGSRGSLDEFVSELPVINMVSNNTNSNDQYETPIRELNPENFEKEAKIQKIKKTPNLTKTHSVITINNQAGSSLAPQRKFSQARLDSSSLASEIGGNLQFTRIYKEIEIEDSKSSRRRMKVSQVTRRGSSGEDRGMKLVLSSKESVRVREREGPSSYQSSSECRVPHKFEMSGTISNQSVFENTALNPKYAEYWHTAFKTPEGESRGVGFSPWKQNDARNRTESPAYQIKHLEKKKSEKIEKKENEESGYEIAKKCLFLGPKASSKNIKPDKDLYVKVDSSMAAESMIVDNMNFETPLLLQKTSKQFNKRSPPQRHTGSNPSLNFAEKKIINDGLRNKISLIGLRKAPKPEFEKRKRSKSIADSLIRNRPTFQTHEDTADGLLLKRSSLAQSKVKVVSASIEKPKCSRSQDYGVSLKPISQSTAIMNKRLAQSDLKNEPDLADSGTKIELLKSPKRVRKFYLSDSSSIKQRLSSLRKKSRESKNSKNQKLQRFYKTQMSKPFMEKESALGSASLPRVSKTTKTDSNFLNSESIAVIGGEKAKTLNSFGFAQSPSKLSVKRRLTQVYESRVKNSSALAKRLSLINEGDTGEKVEQRSLEIKRKLTRNLEKNRKQKIRAELGKLKSLAKKENTRVPEKATTSTRTKLEGLIRNRVNSNSRKNQNNLRKVVSRNSKIERRGGKKLSNRRSPLENLGGYNTYSSFADAKKLKKVKRGKEPFPVRNATEMRYSMSQCFEIKPGTSKKLSSAALKLGRSKNFVGSKTKSYRLKKGLK